MCACIGHISRMKNNIRAMRERAGLTQGQLAKAIGTTHGYVGKMERGEKRIALDWIHKIAGALNCRPDDLVSSDEGSALPSATTLATMFRIVLSNEKAGHVPPDDLRKYGIVARNVLEMIQDGQIVQDDHKTIEAALMSGIRLSVGGTPLEKE